MKEKRKVFCLGLTRTGKTSLDQALMQFGYRVKHYPHPPIVMEEAERYDALSDITVIPYMEELDRRYPDALFVLTVRDVENWLDVMCTHYKQCGRPTERQKRVRKLIYGTAECDREQFRKAWHRHIERVLDYFAGRPDKLLVMDICGGQGYETLCPALELPILDESFPHANRLLVPGEEE